jgi:hypothetical protein
MQASNRSRLILIATLFAMGSQLVNSASDAQDLRRLPPQYEAVASRLRSAQPQQYDFSKAMLADVLRFLATDAGISFFSLPDDSELGSKLITFSINASPFKVLETLCRANGLAILPDNDIWYIRPADDRELEGKSYEVRHNALERVEKSPVTAPLAEGAGLAAAVKEAVRVALVVKEAVAVSACKGPRIPLRFSVVKSSTTSAPFLICHRRSLRPPSPLR